MRSFETSIDIPARPERVWDVLARVVDWPTWTPTVRAVRPLDAPEFAIGRRYEVHQPRLRPAVWEIRSVTPGEEFTWTMATPGLRAEASHRVDPLGPDAARATLAVCMTGPLSGLVWLLAGRLTRAYVAQEAASQKRRLEETSA